MAEAIDAINQAVKTTTMKTGKYLTFSLDEEEY